MKVDHLSVYDPRTLLFEPPASRAERNMRCVDSQAAKLDREKNWNISHGLNVAFAWR